MEIIRATCEDEARVFEFLRQHFYPDEPLSVCVKRQPPTDQADCPSLALLKQNLSFLAVNHENPSEICGIFINGEIKGNENLLPVDELLEKHKNQAYGKILAFVKYTNIIMEHELEKRWNNNEITSAFHIALIAVGTKYRRQKLANKLMEKTIELAKEKGHKWMTIECSSTYSTALASKFGFQIIHELPYDNYKDENGDVIFHTKPPHNKFSLLIKDL